MNKFFLMVKLTAKILKIFIIQFYYHSLGHVFQSTIINIATVCEICQQFLLWPIERGLVSSKMTLKKI